MYSRLLLLILLLVVPVGAASPDSIGHIRARGVLRVGTTGDYPPFTLRYGVGYRGLDIDMSHSLAHTLGVRLQIVPTTWPTLMQDLLAARFDLAMGGISASPQRARQAAFSRSYMVDGKVAIAHCADIGRYAALTDIDQPWVRVIVNPGGTNERFVRGHCSHADIVMWPDNRTIFQHLAAGDADVMITDRTEALYQAHRNPSLCVVGANHPFTHDQKVYLLPRGSALKPYVDRWLARSLTSGEFRRFYAASMRE